MVKFAERLAAAWALAGGVLLVAIMIVTSINVGAFGLDKIARAVGTTVSGLPGYEDFVRLAISCAALMFFPYCQLRRGHVTVDLLTQLLPPSVRRGLDRLWLATIVLLALFLAYWMIYGMVETARDNVLSPVLGWQQWPFYVPGIVSLFLWSAIAVIQFVEGTDRV